MIKKLYDKAINTFLTREFIIFVLIGVINTFNGSILSYLYSFIIENVNVAFVLGYITSLCIAYLLNSLIAFKESLAWSKLIKFAISYIPNFIIQNIVVLIFYNTLHWHKLLAFAIAAIIGIPVTFILIKIFAFGKKK